MRSRFLVVAAATAIIISGCGRDAGNQQDTAKAVSQGKASGEITVWAMGTEGEKLGEFEFAKAFTAENPDAKVTVTTVPWDGAGQKLSAAIAAKQTPDVSMIGTTMQGTIAKTGALDPTPTDLFAKDAYFPVAWDTTVVDGTSYGAPGSVHAPAVVPARLSPDPVGPSVAVRPAPRHA
jgi:multiple sugar transport system substrate-binding protein